MISRIVISAILLVAGPSALPAQPSVPPEPVGIVAGTYRTDPSHTAVGWRVNHMGFNDAFGLFGAIRGTLVFNPADPAAAIVNVRIPVRKVVTADTGLTAALLRPNGVGGKPYYFGSDPADALFVSTAVKPGSDGRSAVIEGKLTLNGRTAPVTIQASFAGSGKNRFTGKQTLGFHGKATINRTQWGLESDLPLVGNIVELTISAAFELQPSSKAN